VRDSQLPVQECLACRAGCPAAAAVSAELDGMTTVAERLRLHRHRPHRDRVDRLVAGFGGKRRAAR